MASFSLNGKLKTKFGLIQTKPAKKNSAVSAFQDDDEDDLEALNIQPKSQLHKPKPNPIPKAEETDIQDSSIFDYDKHLEQKELEREREKEKVKQGSRYIQDMKKANLIRQSEKEIIQEKKLSRGIKEGEKVEEFITESFKEHQEDREVLLEPERPKKEIHQKTKEMIEKQIEEEAIKQKEKTEAEMEKKRQFEILKKEKLKRIIEQKRNEYFQREEKRKLQNKLY